MLQVIIEKALLDVKWKDARVTASWPENDIKFWVGRSKFSIKISNFTLEILFCKPVPD